VSFKDLCILFC